MSKLELIEGIQEDETIEFVVEELLKVERMSWKSSMQAQQEQIRSRLQIFSDGLFRLYNTESNEIMAYVYVIRLNESFILENKSWDGITADGTAKTHNPKGDALFGITLGTTSSGMGRVVLERALESIRKSNRFEGIQNVFLCGRIPSLFDKLTKSSENLTIDATIVEKDPTIQLFMRAGFSVYEIVEDGYEVDKDSMGYSALLKQKL